MSANFKKIQHLWTVICRNSRTDTLTNNLSLEDVLDQIQIGKKDPAGKSVLPSKGDVVKFEFQVVSLWKKISAKDEAIAAEGELQVLDPDGEVLLKHPFPIAFEKGKSKSRAIVGFNGFRVTIPGEYVFKIRAREGKKGDFIDADEAYLTVQFAV